MPVMSYFVSPEFLRFVLLGGIVVLQVKWRSLVNTIVLEAYLDEVFHVPQAQAYWQAKWSHWDPKITTPPGLYVFSYACNTVQSWWRPEFQQTTQELRYVNSVLIYLLLVVLYVWAAVARREVDHDRVLQREFSIICFPLIFFFSALYYTDLLSTFSVMVTYTWWLAGVQTSGGKKVSYQLLHLLAGIAALATRQTNIFWVAVYLGGLQLVETVKRAVGEKAVHDPPIAEAYFEDFPTTTISIAQHAVNIFSRLIFDLWPQLALLAAFAFFVVWNGGVVLGDKSNHVATLHLPQLLYLFPCIVLFSWPALLPSISNLLIAGATKRGSTSQPSLSSKLGSLLPRPATCLCFLAILLIAIHYNTTIHPFILADNRHYTFYVFRITILFDNYLRYALAPIYIICAWLCINALGDPSSDSSARISTSQTTGETAAKFGRADTIRVSWAIVYLTSTALSLVTAPLVEPRYFIIPWLMWRLHVPEQLPTAATCPAATASPQVQMVGRISDPYMKANGKLSNQDTSKSMPKASSWDRGLAVLHLFSHHAPYIELLWYLLINAFTCYMFLYRGFGWPQEPGKVQRFLW